MSLRLRSCLSVLALVAAAGCSSSTSGSGTSSSDVRSVTNVEALSDFDQIASSFRGLYGAMDRKQARYGFDFETIVKEYRDRVAASTTEADYQGIFQEFIARFEDAHVSLYGKIDSDDAHSLSLPFEVMPVEDTYVIYQVGKTFNAAQVGEELLAIDGVTTKDLYTQLAKYQGIPNPLAKKHFVASNFTYRPSYMVKGIDPATPAKLSIRGVDGTVREVSIPWTNTPNLVKRADLKALAPVPAGGQSGPDTASSTSTKTMDLVRAELNKQGDRVPFFMTDAVNAALGITGEVKPSPAALVNQALAAQNAVDLDFYAVKYFTNGKKVLLVRLPDYSPKDPANAIKYLKALFEDNLDSVDALVFDEGHNPGGNIAYAVNVLSLLAKKEINGYVQQMHADRLWLSSYAYWANYDSRPDYRSAFLGYTHSIDDAYSNGRSLSGPIPFYRKTNTIAPDANHWTKPVMMIHDSLSVSCADLVPLLFKTNKMGQTFGETTMGGGGSVEEVANLVNTQGALSISRGVGTVFDPTGAYPEENVIEDNGVAPTAPYAQTLADYRAGYVGYVAAFNKVLTTQIATEAAAAAPAAQP